MASEAVVVDESPLTNPGSNDPSWTEARNIVQRNLNCSGFSSQLIRSAWVGLSDQKDFLRVLGFSKINIHCLVDAAGLDTDLEHLDASLVERALQNLGVRLAAVVVGVSLTCQAVLKSRPPIVWKKIFRDMMTDIEIGYKIGSRVMSLGVEGGALAGFGMNAGLAVLLADNPDPVKRWFSTPPEHRPEFPTASFGCEPYQVSAFVLQQLGFGTDIAIGVALGNRSLKAKHVQLTSGIKHWNSAALWIRALKEARNYPADLEIRAAFPEIAPPKEPQGKNLVLEVLYTEIAKVRLEGSKWTWHLPKGAQDLT